jgi:hypothetical protein
LSCFFLVFLQGLHGGVPGVGGGHCVDHRHVGVDVPAVPVEALDVEVSPGVEVGGGAAADDGEKWDGGKVGLFDDRGGAGSVEIVGPR